MSNRRFVMNYSSNVHKPVRTTLINSIALSRVNVERSNKHHAPT